MVTRLKRWTLTQSGAIDAGVVALKRLQQRDGTWRHTNMGATSLAALTLLECGEEPDSPAVVSAAAAIRNASIGETHTYSISLAILFLDRLGDVRDIPLIESLTVRLLAGQTSRGGWSYNCPAIGQAEMIRLGQIVQQRNVLKGGKELPKRKPGEKRTVKDLAPQIKQQLMLINRFAPGAKQNHDDNSNTQFATLALWVARRHGLPVHQAIARIDARYRLIQQVDGGWSYSGNPPGRGMPAGPMSGSTAAMTCAGLLGLAVNYGSVRELIKDKKKMPDPKNDRSLKAGLLALSTAIGIPMEGNQFMRGAVNINNRNGTAYYFLWSLERVAVALDLRTIGKKDWYEWGSQVLLKNQARDGSWQGNYSAYGADTCFALLFLRRTIWPRT